MKSIHNISPSILSDLIKTEVTYSDGGVTGKNPKLVLDTVALQRLSRQSRAITDEGTIEIRNNDIGETIDLSNGRVIKIDNGTHTVGGKTVFSPRVNFRPKGASDESSDYAEEKDQYINQEIIISTKILDTGVGPNGDEVDNRFTIKFLTGAHHNKGPGQIGNKAIGIDLLTTGGDFDEPIFEAEDENRGYRNQFNSRYYGDAAKGKLSLSDLKKNPNNTIYVNDDFKWGNLKGKDIKAKVVSFLDRARTTRITDFSMDFGNGQLIPIFRIRDSGDTLKDKSLLLRGSDTITIRTDGVSHTISDIKIREIDPSVDPDYQFSLPRSSFLLRKEESLISDLDITQIFNNISQRIEELFKRLEEKTITTEVVLNSTIKETYKTTIKLDGSINNEFPCQITNKDIYDRHNSLVDTYLKDKKDLYLKVLEAIDNHID